tara:strand:+ start:250 stop:468 length:219 start_codon:yes stop_codon:yes gene_type:complete
MNRSNKKYNPKDYKDAEFITLGDGPIRVQIDRRHMRNMADYWFFAKHLFTMESEAGLIKTLAEEKENETSSK